MKHKRLWPLIGIIVVSLLSIIAPPSGLAATGGTFVFGQPAAPATLDPQQTKENESQRVVVQMYEGLLAMDKTSTKVVPWLAEKYAVSKDGTVWIFSLRNGVKFHDGTPFNAEAGVFNFDRQRLSLSGQ